MTTSQSSLTEIFKSSMNYCKLQEKKPPQPQTTKQQHKNLANQLYLIKKIKNKEFGKLVHLVNLAISSYGKFNFSELPLRNI